MQRVIPAPSFRTSLFGGEHLDTLYETCSDRVYQRKLKVIGVKAWDVQTSRAEVVTRRRSRLRLVALF